MIRTLRPGNPSRAGEVPAADIEAMQAYLDGLPDIFDEVVAEPSWRCQPDPRNPDYHLEGPYAGMRLTFRRGDKGVEFAVFQTARMLKKEKVVEWSVKTADAALKRAGP